MQSINVKTDEEKQNCRTYQASGVYLWRFRSNACEGLRLSGLSEPRGFAWRILLAAMPKTGTQNGDEIDVIDLVEETQRRGGADGHNKKREGKLRRSGGGRAPKQFSPGFPSPRRLSLPAAYQYVLLRWIPDCRTAAETGMSF